MPRKKVVPVEAGVNDIAPSDGASHAAPTKPATKAQAMDAALAAGAGMPAEGVAYVKAHYGLDVSTKQFSTHKSLAKQKATIDARAAKPKAAPAKPAEPAVRAGPATRPGGRANPADLARQLKSLVAAHGVEAVEEMLAVFKE